MPKITDPDDLVRTTDVDYNTGTKRISVVSTGNIDSKDGVTLKAVYSFTKEQWKSDTNLIPHPFPFVPITDEQFELVQGWDFADDASRYLIRDAGWAVKVPGPDTVVRSNAEWAGIISLGNIESDDQPYFQQAGGAPVTFQTQGVINQAVKIYEDTNADGTEDFDYRNSLTLFTREEAQIYGSANLADIGVTDMSYQAYRFPLATATDLNINETDANIASNSPYTEIAVRYFPTAFSREVDTTTARDFGIVIDVGTHSGVDGSVTAAGTTFTSAEGGIPTDATYVNGLLTIHEGSNKGRYRINSITDANNLEITADAGPPALPGTFPATDSGMSFTLQRPSGSVVVASKFEIYEKVQYLLRQSGDIDATSDTNTGQTASELLEFVGPTLKAGTKIPTNHAGGGSGVIIEGFDSGDTNDLEFVDNTATTRTYPFVAAGTINFNDNLQADQDPIDAIDPTSSYWMFFQYTHRVTNAGFGISGSSGQTATLDSSVYDLTNLTQNDFIRLSGFTNDENDGIWQVTGVPAGSGPWTAAVTKVDSFAPIDESAAATVSLDRNPIDSPDAIVVQAATTPGPGQDISGNVTGATAAFDFDYDNNNQGGRTPATNAAVVIRAIGLAAAQFVQATGTITRTTGITFTLVSPLERNYAS